MFSLLFAILMQSALAKESLIQQPNLEEKMPAAEKTTPAEENLPAPPMSSTEDRMVYAINAYRLRYKLRPLRADQTLLRVARLRARYFSHCPPNYGWCWTHCRQAGYRGWATDNLAQGYLTPEETVSGWARSPGHASQMRGLRKLNGRWQDFRATRVGVARAGRNWVAIFGN